MAANREGILLATYASLAGIARSEELEVNQWIVQGIHWLSSQSERAKNTIHCLSIY